MRRFHALIALAVLAASSGCQSMVPGRPSFNAGGSGQLTQSQTAPRPEILRTSYQSCGYGAMGGPCGCGECCDSCGGNGVCDSCSGGGCNSCNGSGCCACGCASSCGLCTRYCGCGCECGQSRNQGMMNSAVSALASGGYRDHIYDFNPGPPVAQVAYPYYTVRGPRDYLRNNPPPLGPY